MCGHMPLFLLAPEEEMGKKKNGSGLRTRKISPKSTQSG